jgi:hypothetical protein
VGGLKTMNEIKYRINQIQDKYIVQYEEPKFRKKWWFFGEQVRISNWVSSGKYPCIEEAKEYIKELKDYHIKCEQSKKVPYTYV